MYRSAEEKVLPPAVDPDVKSARGTGARDVCTPEKVNQSSRPIVVGSDHAGGAMVLSRSRATPTP
jgi:hypothetical protein